MEKEDVINKEKKLLSLLERQINNMIQKHKENLNPKKIKELIEYTVNSYYEDFENGETLIISIFYHNKEIFVYNTKYLTDKLKDKGHEEETIHITDIIKENIIEYLKCRLCNKHMKY